MKKTNKTTKRTLGRQLAKELSKGELATVAGALPPNTTCSGGCADDCG